MFHYTLLFLVCCYSVFTAVTGLRCVECFGALTESECATTGKIRQCINSQDACEIELRYHEGWGGGQFIVKQCKESRACDNNHVQNPRDAWFPTQCNPNIRNSVCRCCCFTDLCNVERKDCFGQVTCPSPPSYIHNGAIVCSNGRLPGSQCSISCNIGTVLIGAQNTQCTSRGYWSHPFPRCGDIICSQRIDIRNGWFSCTRGNYAGSICRAQCRPGHIMRGFIQSTCTIQGRWTTRPPFCVPITCIKLPRVIGGKTKCSDKNNIQSRCRTTCNKDRTMEGIPERHCQENGEWSHKLPTCEEINCPKQKNILFGSSTCSKGTRAASICNHSCNEGFKLIGELRSVCQLDGKWSSPLPVCKRILCPPRGFLIFGKVSCSAGSFSGSICRSECNAGSVMIGEAESECTNVGNWTVSLPVCNRLQCVTRGSVENAYVSCTDRNFVRSRCSVRCDRGYKVDGLLTSTCLDTEEWSSPLPVCEQVKCEPRFEVERGRVRCTNDNISGSTCTVTCDPDKVLSGQPISTCKENKNWSVPLADCENIQCPPRRSIDGGFIICTDENFVESDCTYTCNPGKILIGQPSSTCQRSKLWTYPLPSCLDLKCTPRRVLLGGEVICTNRNIAGSTCRVTCFEGLFVSGPPVSNCMNSGVWDAGLPTCERIFCPPRTLVENGIISCTDGSFFESECTVTCSQFYELDGKASSICMDTGEWNTDLPICNKLQCRLRGELEFGRVICSNGNDLNSVCEASCEDGYVLVGTADSECLLTTEWSAELPFCEVNKCLPRGEVEGGEVFCDKGQDYGSVCSVICDFARRPIGITSSICMAENANENAKWNVPLPRCERLKCEDQGELKHGEITCSDGTYVQSVCEFNCLDFGYQVYPAGRNRNVCRRSREWTIPKPCCTRLCPPYALIDIVVVLDSSSSIGSENWVMLTDFVEGIIRSFIVDRTSVNFAIFRYNKVVDEESQIYLNSHPESVEDLVVSFNKFEYNGSGTRTGNALNHALKVSLTEANGNRPDIKDVVFVITDGKASDDVLTPSIALRKQGVTILVLGIQPPRGFLDLTQLRNIAGSDENLVIAETGFTGLTSDFGLKLSKTICGKPCT